MNLTTTIQKGVRNSILALTIATAAFASHSAQAGAFAVDSRNGWWTYARAMASEGDPVRQYNLAVNRAVNWGGDVRYIRCSQFNVPRGTYVECSVGYVPGKGWCGNWAINGADSSEGLRRQGATSINRGVFTWIE